MLHGLVEKAAGGNGCVREGLNQIRLDNPPEEPTPRKGQSHKRKASVISVYNDDAENHVDTSEGCVSSSGQC